MTKAEKRAVSYIERHSGCTARDYATHVYGNPGAQLAAGSLLTRLTVSGLIHRYWLFDAWHYRKVEAK